MEILLSLVQVALLLMIGIRLFFMHENVQHIATTFGDRLFRIDRTLEDIRHDSATNLDELNKTLRNIETQIERMGQ